MHRLQSRSEARADVLLVIASAVAAVLFLWFSVQRSALPESKSVISEAEQPATAEAPLNLGDEIEEQTADKPPPYRLVPIPVHTEWIPVTCYTPTSDARFTGKRATSFANVNFLKGGKHYDALRPYPTNWTRLEWIKSAGWKVVAVPRRWDRVHTDRILYPDGTWGHRYVVGVPGFTERGEYAIPLDRITKRHRVDCLRFIPDREARKYGAPLLPVTVYELRKIGRK